LLLGLFLAIAAISLFLPSNTASSLKTVTSEQEEENQKITVTSYVRPSDGKVTVASDRGYASVRKTIRDGHTVLEEYLDAKGEPAVLPAGYSAIRREYTDGLNMEIVYLGPDGNPAVTSSGYDTIRRSYTEARLADTDTYWRSGAQVGRTEGYWSLHRIYGSGADQKRVVRQEYRGKAGELTNNTSGYAYFERKYDENGKVTEQRYYNALGEPAPIDIGYCGYQRDYDEKGRTVETRYLDAAWQTADTDRGYAIVRNEYTQQGTKTLYFDQAGQPVTAGKSQYGVLTTEDGTAYLNEAGEVIFRLDQFLLSNQGIVIILGALVTLLALFLEGKARTGFLILYGLFILYMTMAYREAGDSRSRMELFWSYRQYWTNAQLRLEILNNIFLFVPFGTALQPLWPGRPGRAILRTGLVCLLFSAGIETVQLLTGIGLFEFDDMISNTLGGLIGGLLYYVWKTGKRKMERGRKRHHGETALNSF